jgi:hypothetical protein
MLQAANQGRQLRGGQITIRDGKGGKDRMTMVPSVVKADLAEHIDRAAWQWVFPATRCYVDPATGQRRRHHLHESAIQRAVREGIAAGDMGALPCDPHAKSRRIRFRGRRRYTARLAAFTVLRGSR